jgi:triphosphoribosyl-dephospho-CoA synthase
MTASSGRFSGAVSSAVLTIPPDLHRGGSGWCAAVASILEAAAAKPGNVHPGASFDDLTFHDFVAAGIAIAAPLEHAWAQPLGDTILDAVRAAVQATPSNANLGIILLIAPLATVPLHRRPLTADAVDAVFATLTAADAAAVWNAIRHARPGGMGNAERHDLAGPPPADIREAMAIAADRDAIASLWAHGFEPLFSGAVADLAADVANSIPLEHAIVRAHVRQLARQPDSLIARRHGEAAARQVSSQATKLVALENQPNWPAAIAAFDTSLRSPRRLNPGTTADLVAAALYILLRDDRLPVPFLP